MTEHLYSMEDFGKANNLEFSIEHTRGEEKKPFYNGYTVGISSMLEMVCGLREPLLTVEQAFETFIYKEKKVYKLLLLDNNNEPEMFVKISVVEG